MKKLTILLIIATVILSGCSKVEEMPDFIPTMAPKKEEAKPTEELSEKEEKDTETMPAPTIYVGDTTTKYVKLSKYNDTLNIRSKPSTSGDKVGFLVHTEAIEVIDIVDGWASFLYKDSISYVKADYLVDEKPAYLDPE